MTTPKKWEPNYRELKPTKPVDPEQYYRDNPKPSPEEMKARLDRNRKKTTREIGLSGHVDVVFERDKDGDATRIRKARP